MIWLIVQVTVSTVAPVQPTADRLDRLARSADELQRSFTTRVTQALRGHGWPAGVFDYQRDQWFACAPGQAPQPTVPRDPPGWTIGNQFFVAVHHHADPSVSTIWTLKWPIALLQLAYLQILATILAGVFITLMGWPARWRRHRTRTPA